ncbi:MAG TPA: hypothetical protein VGK40_12650, partial [Verrucomicrobiae bacterium]
PHQRRKVPPSFVLLRLYLEARFRFNIRSLIKLRGALLATLASETALRRNGRSARFIHRLV